MHLVRRVMRNLIYQQMLQLNTLSHYKTLKRFKIFFQKIKEQHYFDNNKIVYFSIIQEPESWKLTPEESLAQAKLVKDKATGFLKQEKYQLAIKLYEKSNLYLSNCSKFDNKCLRVPYRTIE